MFKDIGYTSSTLIRPHDDTATRQVVFDNRRRTIAVYEIRPTRVRRSPDTVCRLVSHRVCQRIGEL